MGVGSTRRRRAPTEDAHGTDRRSTSALVRAIFQQGERERRARKDVEEAARCVRKRAILGRAHSWPRRNPREPHTDLFSGCADEMQLMAPIKDPRSRNSAAALVLAYLFTTPSGNI